MITLWPVKVTRPHFKVSSIVIVIFIHSSPSSVGLSLSLSSMDNIFIHSGKASSHDSLAPSFFVLFFFRFMRLLWNVAHVVCHNIVQNSMYNSLQLI